MFVSKVDDTNAFSQKKVGDLLNQSYDTGNSNLNRRYKCITDLVQAGIIS